MRCGEHTEEVLRDVAGLPESDLVPSAVTRNVPDGAVGGEGATWLRWLMP